MALYKNKLLNLTDFKTLSFKEFVLQIQKVYDEEVKALLLFCYATGIRPSECNLRREDFELQKNRIIVTIKTKKGGFKRRLYIPITNYYYEYLKNYISKKIFPKEYIFPTFVKKKNPRAYLINYCKRKQIGIEIDGKLEPFTFYYFRHNILTLLAQNGLSVMQLLLFKGASLKFMFKSLGHYIHFSDKEIKEIEKVLKKILNI